jgi:hypothetical protein
LFIYYHISYFSKRSSPKIDDDKEISKKKKRKIMRVNNLEWEILLKENKKWNLLIWVIVVAIISYNCDPTRWN